MKPPVTTAVPDAPKEVTIYVLVAVVAPSVEEALRLTGRIRRGTHALNIPDGARLIDAIVRPDRPDHRPVHAALGAVLGKLLRTVYPRSSKGGRSE